MEKAILAEAMRLNRGLMVLLSVSSLAAGAAAGVVFSSKRLEKKYADISSAEIAEAREAYERMTKTGDFSTPEKAAAILITETVVSNEPNVFEMPPPQIVEVLEQYQGTPPADRKKYNAFSNPISSENVPADTTDPTVPYVITSDDFTVGTPDYDQITITWYEGDSVLADDKDQPIDLEEYIGSESLTHFGENSGDEMIVYVRNDRLETDFEVVKSDGKYSVQVLGMDDSLTHSSEPIRRRRRARFDDE